jgi:hypothetical protein
VSRSASWARRDIAANADIDFKALAASVAPPQRP